MKEKINILGIQYSKITFSELLKEIESNLNQNKITISFAPVDSTMLCYKNNYLKKIYNSFDYVLADGMPILFASKILKKSLPERVAGLDLLQRMINLCSKKRYSVFFLGSNKKTVEKFKKKLFNNKFPVKFYCPPMKKKFNFEDNKIMIDEINKFKPDFLFVILGAPKQDIWIYENTKKIDAKAIIGIGAAFDYYAGTIKRAPEWMQKLGLEWLFRLIQDPKRLWKRYARDLIFPFLIIKELIKNSIFD
jgi:N-acetylglucosaminyldiphosphoundecaprenol N-acetyl-beta-D-mannosaminyltransferase